MSKQCTELGEIYAAGEVFSQTPASSSTAKESQVGVIAPTGRNGSPHYLYLFNRSNPSNSNDTHRGLYDTFAGTVIDIPSTGTNKDKPVFNGTATNATNAICWAGKSLWVGTATEYAALTTKDANTIYLVTAD